MLAGGGAHNHQCALTNEAWGGHGGQVWLAETADAAAGRGGRGQAAGDLAVAKRRTGREKETPEVGGGGKVSVVLHTHPSFRDQDGGKAYGIRAVGVSG